MRTRIVLMFVGAGLAASTVISAAAETPELTEIRVTSSLDGSEQPSLVWAPATAKSQTTPLFVFLHSWSGNYKQDNSAWLAQAVERGWIYLHPDFRGPNSQPDACGSKLARQDVLDAIDWAIENYRVDESRIYLAGSSGGGHMTMLMAAYHPERFSAASAWVGISDLTKWHAFHVQDGKPQRYAQMLADSCGGAPGTSAAVDAEYRARSPLFHLGNVGDLPLDLAAGVKDGHTGSVPIHHTLWAFNAIAEAHQATPVTDVEMQQLWEIGRLETPREGDTVDDESYGRKLFLRRFAGKSRVTIFDGGHEGLAPAGAAWLAQHVRMTRHGGKSDK